MRKFIILGFVLASFMAKAQEVQQVSIEKNLNSVQLGLLSLSYQNEIKLDRKISLKSEIGFATSTTSREYSNGDKETSFLIVPFINVEPRWYYGLDRRSCLKRETKNNSSNYFSLLTSFISGRTALLNTKSIDAAPFITITPEYGIRRSLGKHFYSEYSAGVGYKHNFFGNSYTYSVHENQMNIDVQWKIGYFL